MNTETLNKSLETLAGYVFDNDKLVTYKWLSKELHVHVNIAKQILLDFHQKYQNNNIECTYLLIGHLKEKQRGMRVEVVKGSNLSEAKEKFSKIISEHVYSVHKPIADLELLATSGSGDINYSAIKCDACKERTDEEMQLLRWGTITTKVTTENVTNLKSTNLTNPLKTEKNPITTKKNGFNNLFNMAEKSKSSEKLKSSFQESDKDSMKKKKDTENDKNCVQKDKDSVEKIQNLTEKNKNSVVNSTTKKVSPQNNSKKGKLDNFFGKRLSPSKSTEVISSEKKNNNAKKEVTEGKVIKEKKNSHGKKRNRSKETNEVAKKRKRIVVQDDSSDSEIQSDVEMEESVPEIEPETPMKDKSPSPPKVKHENGKRKVLKLINRTYKEGEYIVTKKEHVYVSCSEDEEEKKEEMKRKEQKKTETKMGNVKKKQSTLTNFFKKC
ncbi:PREDICTED: DNA polymerase delta subunit 3-like [Cyphomyrmex costatus]|uniref:DNA polymerase delta subunit 3 n=1 Tax=Cyphomyrmex costatus TaxID=456900 RepID=A0A195D0S2_9HYME|nr:PREDICTED: DNA polymerase delta subunit 3-like [Cyphomyrmex costatus]KYN06456.1 DNA polymerase delta subunit 3 [Cyphomyrmex costatus]